jgi:hypothetical protein
MSRMLTVLYTFDCFVLAMLTLGNCRVGETISSVAWEPETDGKLLGLVLRPMIDHLFWFDRDHCQQAEVTFLRITTGSAQKVEQVPVDVFRCAISLRGTKCFSEPNIALISI